jgi:hypothetical protein
VVELLDQILHVFVQIFSDKFEQMVGTTNASESIWFIENKNHYFVPSLGMQNGSSCNTKRNLAKLAAHKS